MQQVVLGESLDPPQPESLHTAHQIQSTSHSGTLQTSQWPLELIPFPYIAAGGTMSLTGFDINNNVIDSLSVTDTGGNTMVLNSATKNIRRVRFVGTGNVAFDDVQFNTVEAVPQPAMMTIFALAALTVARRRTHSSKGQGRSPDRTHASYSSLGLCFPGKLLNE